MKKTILTVSLSLVLAASSAVPGIANFRNPLYSPNVVYATSIDPVDTIADLIPGIDEEDISVEQHPAEQITEKTINGVWEAVNSKVSITFNTGGPASVLTSISGVLEKLMPIISKACETASIESGGHQEYLSYIPPNFSDNKFDIIAYDPYATTGRFEGDLESSTDDTVYRIKVYPEFSADDPIEYSLKNLEKLNLPATSTMQNLILEFYAGDEQTPFDKIYIPADKTNKNFGICLTKTKSHNYVYYLAKETRHHISNTYMVDKIMVPLYGDNVIFDSNLESVWNNMSSSEQAEYGPLIWKNAAEIDKGDISKSQFHEDYILSLWQDPKHLLRGDTMIIYGNNYYSNFSQNTEKILVNEQGEEKANLGLQFNENGKAAYQIYIPKTGTYELNYIFTHDTDVDFAVKNLSDGQTVYSMEAPAPEDGQSHVKVSVPREIELNEGLLYIEIEGSNFDLNCMLLKYLGNKDEDRANYLQGRCEAIRLDVVNAIDRLDRGSTSKEELEGALQSAYFVRDNLVLPKKQDLLDKGYSPDEALMQEIDNHIQDLHNRITQAEADLESFPSQSAIEVIVEAENAYDNIKNMRVSQSLNVIFSEFTCKDLWNGDLGTARYKVTIPKAGYYKPEYFVSSYYTTSSMNVLDENGRTFDNIRIPKTNEGFSLNFTSVEGTREYFEAGETYISVYCTNETFMLDKIKLIYDGE